MDWLARAPRLTANFFALDTAEQRLIVEALAMLTTAAVEARLFPVRRYLDATTFTPSSTAEPIDSTVHRRRALDVAIALRRAARALPWHSTCLIEALAARRMLGRRGLTSSLRIGVRLGANGDVEAHAWVEYQGEVLIGNIADLEQFLALPGTGHSRA